MRFNVRLHRTQYKIGSTSIEAESQAEAEDAAQNFEAKDIAEWELADDDLIVVSVTPSLEPLFEGDRASDATEAARPPSEVREALRRVVDYLYDDEAEDYQTLTQAEQREHVFEAVLCVARWLAKLERI